MDVTKCKIQNQDMEVTRVKSQVKIWKSQVQDHEMSESSGKEELCNHHAIHKSINTVKSSKHVNTVRHPPTLEPLDSYAGTSRQFKKNTEANISLEDMQRSSSR